jgi:hypothetical protein
MPRLRWRGGEETPSAAAMSAAALLCAIVTLAATPSAFAQTGYIASQTCTYAVSDPPTNYSTWTRDQCTNLVYSLVEDGAGNALYGLHANRDSRMRNCCPLATEFFRCFTTSNWSAYNPPSAVKTMTSINPKGCTGFFDDQVAMKSLGFNLDCPIPPAPYCEPVQNCLAAESPRNFTDASGTVILGPWPNIETGQYGTLSCSSKADGPAVGKYTGLLRGYCENGTVLPTTDSCTPSPCSVDGGAATSGTDASGVKLWGPWPAVSSGSYSYIECNPYYATGPIPAEGTFSGTISRFCQAGVLQPTADSCIPDNCPAVAAGGTDFAGTLLRGPWPGADHGE